METTLRQSCFAVLSVFWASAGSYSSVLFRENEFLTSSAKLSLNAEELRTLERKCRHILSSCERLAIPLGTSSSTRPRTASSISSAHRASQTVRAREGHLDGLVQQPGWRREREVDEGSQRSFALLSFVLGRTLSKGRTS